ncbi:MAG TPA: hypothetical protein PKD09_16665 [Aggregatilinea sp.]|jgi:hypothetical protein|uniref:hypothetical protein n=1 Tax=Aggregatilinea sp. TaxID=2806333 RepID=UPI002CB173A6|nr:hypothetical protein [Aggregatilinea sp.]HML23289.1 hypothetical protein [Aggregatilinea sp.]
MDRDTFGQLFNTVLEQAVVDAENRLGTVLSRSLEIELHGAGHHGDRLSPAAALSSLYIGPDVFYRIIDVAVMVASPRLTRVFVRASNHQPGDFEHTWNTPEGNGPFKILLSSVQIIE